MEGFIYLLLVELLWTNVYEETSFEITQLFWNCDWYKSLLDFFLQTKTRISNERYLRDHPEVECLIQSFVRYYYCFIYPIFKLSS